MKETQIIYLFNGNIDYHNGTDMKYTIHNYATILLLLFELQSGIISCLIEHNNVGRIPLMTEVTQIFNIYLTCNINGHFIVGHC
jgi:hypothetical protein